MGSENVDNIKILRQLRHCKINSVSELQVKSTGISKWTCWHVFWVCRGLFSYSLVKSVWNCHMTELWVGKLSLLHGPIVNCNFFSTTWPQLTICGFIDNIHLLKYNCNWVLWRYGLGFSSLLIPQNLEHFNLFGLLIEQMHTSHLYSTLQQRGYHFHILFHLTSPRRMKASPTFNPEALPHRHHWGLTAVMANLQRGYTPLPGVRNAALNQKQSCKVFSTRKDFYKLNNRHH